MRLVDWLDAKIQIDIAAAVIAAVAIGISWWVYRRQSRLDLEHLRMQRDNDIISWSNRALDAFCSAEMLLREEYWTNSDQSEYELERLRLMRDISSCIDQGRLYFPNLHKEKYGLHKESAFQGVRRALDCLVSAYDMLHNEVAFDKAVNFEGRRVAVTKSKREFVSEVQSEVDPVRRVSFLKSLAADARAA